MKLPEKSITKFKKIIWDFYSHNKRNLPWRNTTDPYKILISEVMLQQTQVNRVIKKYQEFINKFPTIKKLANATQTEVLRVWQGLGYNRRALALKKTAGIIEKTYHGQFPDNPEILQTLPGIGIVTAASIIVFTHNKSLTFIETNIRTVFIHHFFEGKEDIPDKDLLPLIEKTTDTKNPREWYYALMDYGTMLKKEYKNPSRKSTHYKKQSKFQGSNRQIRGMIIKILIEKGSLTQKELTKLMGKDPAAIEKNIHLLQKEGFLKKNRNKIKLRDHS